MKVQRLYRIKHKTTGLYFSGRTEYIGKKKVRTLLFINTPENLELKDIRIRVKNVVRIGLQAQLNQCKIEAIEVIHEVVRTTANLKNMQDRAEQEKLASILRGTSYGY